MKLQHRFQTESSLALKASQAIMLLLPAAVLAILSSPTVMAQDATSAMPSDSISAPSNDTSPLDPAGQSPSPPAVNFNLQSNSTDSINANVMSIFGTTDTTPQAGYGSQQSSVSGGAGIGGFLSPASNSTSGSLPAFSDLGSLTKMLTTQSAAASQLNGAAGAGSAGAAITSGAAGQPGAASKAAGGGAFLDDPAKSDQSLMGDESAPGNDGSSSLPDGAPPGAEEAQKQAEALAREEGRAPANNQNEGRQDRDHRPDQSARSGFFSVLPDNPARIALVELRQGRYESALEHLTRLYALNPHAIELQYLMGVACVMSQRPAAAEQHYRQVLQSPQAPAQLKQLALTGLRRLRAN